MPLIASDKPSSRPGLHVVIAMVLLLCAMKAAYVLAYCLRFDGFPTGEFAWRLWATLPWVLVAKMMAASWFNVHRGWHRFVTFHDLGTIAKAMTCGTVGVVLIDWFLVPEYSIPRTVVLVDWGGSIALVGLLRSVPRAWRHLQQQWSDSDTRLRALIVGANESGENLLRAISHNRRLNYQVLGFVDETPSLVGHRIAGVPVVGTLDELAELAARYSVDEVLIHSGDLPGKTVRELMETANDYAFNINVLPNYEQLLGGKVSVQPRAVAIEDLLRRESLSLDTPAISQWLRGRTVLVTGSAGSIGSEICRQLVALRPGKIVVVDRSETGQFFLDRELRRLADDLEIVVALADLTDQVRMKAVFEEHQPDIVFHAAAYKHVPLMEDHPGEAIKNIVLATRHVVDLAEEYQAQGLVMISTDKAVNPTSVMGSCKQLAERYVQAKAATSSCRFITVRFGNVLDSAGSVVPVFREQIARGGPITVTHPDIIRFFMMIPEAAQLVIQAGAMGQGGEIFVLDMGEPVKIVDLARDMIRLSGLREGEDIEIEFTGLRPGEKLFEELYGEQETHRKTSHPKIMVADSQSWHLVQVVNEISQLAELSNARPERVRQALSEVVPLYHEPAAERRAA
ncbi:polysaccharide biosynthesis protein [Aeoliella mucimassa]|uniref:UDP-N-acetyl-alpha-D-glucosamine C6 dehydratase n=1 Tax=Aeoliella mucimassa TaxID=2527972 RepID=A0A518AKU8_9BACT|nr:nucleoside-diphosphate sugar epimerase/dehydratase [Aeoliella mucimassa]QDU55355.1 UDP-N-acetyl-alpha-D-glucosamine C6 dehydratase [Aeoliella mucimassa]